jgi:protein-S-isoprenylcysteine O-methyltransferase Ste14
VDDRGGHVDSWRGDIVALASRHCVHGAGSRDDCGVRTFLASGGTPAIFFTRPVRFLIGEEPHRLVQAGLYRVTRNPMYVSVLLVISGQALRYMSWRIAVYGLFVWLGFHIVVVLLEEPHLRHERGAAYDEYCRRVPRWV